MEIGTGIGGRWLTPVGQLRFDLAFGVSEQKYHIVYTLRWGLNYESQKSTLGCLFDAVGGVSDRVAIFPVFHFRQSASLEPNGPCRAGARREMGFWFSG